MSILTEATLPRPSRAPTRASVAKVRLRGRRRARVVGTGLGALTLTLVIIGICVGEWQVSLDKVIPSALGEGHPLDVLMVRDVRMPRVLTGLAVGAALGLSGAVFQSLARNPLASPDILGITGGASLFAVFAITTVKVSGLALSAWAGAGALVTALLIYVLAFRRGALSSYRLVLVGIGVGAVALALLQYFWTRAHLHDAASVTLWLSGSLNGIGWEPVPTLLVAVALLIPLTLVMGRELNAMEMGDETCRGIGVRLERSRLLLLLLAVGLAGAAVAAAGPIAFVAFVAPPIARALSRSQGPPLLNAAMLGACLVLASDYVGREAFGNAQIPVGIITAIVGAPYLLWLLATTNRRGSGD